MGDIFIFNPPDDPIPASGQQRINNKVGGTAVKKQSEIRVRRKGLSDITNLESKQKVMDKDGKNSLGLDQGIIQQLVQENAALMKQLVERNKTIQLCGMELQKLRLNLQSSQQQNLQLAQANSQLLAQINVSKDKLRVLGHELACKNSLLAVRNSGLLNTTYTEAGTSSLADGNIDKPCSTNNKQLSQVVAKGASDEEDQELCCKRGRRRRQSSRFKPEDVELGEDALNKNDVAHNKNDVAHNKNDVALPGNLQNADKGLKACPMSDTCQERSEEALVSSSEGIDCSKPCITNAKHPTKAKRRSTAKAAHNPDKSEPKRPRRRTRSSMLEEDAISLSDSVNAKDMVKDKPDQSLAQEVGNIQDVQITSEHENNPCSSCTESKRHRGPSTAKRASRVEDEEFKREREETDVFPDVFPEQTKRSLEGRPVRRASIKVQSYKEMPLNVKMRRTN